MRAFPEDLARVVRNRWQNLVGGQYVAPACPTLPLLRELLETAYLAASMPEEGRFPKFNLVAIPAEDDGKSHRIGQKWKFDGPRPLSADEIHRLAPAVDLKKSAIWVEWSKLEWQIVGLVDLGTSWHRARMGLEYRYEPPSCLLVQIDRPGRMRVYQGAYHVAALSDGKIEGHKGYDFHLSLHKVAQAGLAEMSGELARPKVEEPRDFMEFEFLALWNTYVAIANSISLQGHGGAIVIIPAGAAAVSKLIMPKYAQDTSVLRSSFIRFMNTRHVLGDLIARQENKEVISDAHFSEAELVSRDAFAELVEATRFVANLAACDGAIVLTGDLRVRGFGAEIGAELRKGARVLEVIDELRRKRRRLEVHQFGQRHRSAIKLVSREREYAVLVISQDGPITAVWSEKATVLVRKSINLVNMNMPWA